MRKKAPKKTKEEKLAENFFPVDESDLKHVIEKEHKERITYLEKEHGKRITELEKQIAELQRKLEK